MLQQRGSRAKCDQTSNRRPFQYSSVWKIFVVLDARDQDKSWSHILSNITNMSHSVLFIPSSGGESDGDQK